MLTAQSLKTVTACRFCWMCRHLCPVGLATGKENNGPRAKALFLYLQEKGLDLAADTAMDMYECALCNACAANCETGYEPPKYIRAARAELLANGMVPAKIRETIDILVESGNLYGADIEAALEQTKIKTQCKILVYAGATAAVKTPGVGGFNSMQALSTRNDDPQKASRPFDAGRDGFVIGEGAGALLFEEYEHAVARGAKIYAEVAGGGMSADAYHLTAPHPEGIGAKKAMLDAIEDAGLKAEDVDYINTHGTSTPVGDVAEVKGMFATFGEHLYKVNISSTKSMTGHLLGAAGSIEALACVMALTRGIIPPTINLENLDPDIDPKLNLTPNVAQKRDIKCALSNTFGFGGHNSSVVFKKI